MGFWEIHPNAGVLSIIALTSTLNYILARKKRKDDLFQLRFDCYNRIVEHTLRKNITKEVISPVILGETFIKVTHDEEALIKSEYLNAEQELFSEVRFLFGAKAYDYLLRSETVLSHYLWLQDIEKWGERRRIRFVEKNPNATADEMREFNDKKTLGMLNQINSMVPVHNIHTLHVFFEQYLLIGGSPSFRGIKWRFLNSPFILRFLKEKNIPQYKIVRGRIKPTSYKGKK